MRISAGLLALSCFPLVALGSTATLQLDLREANQSRSIPVTVDLNALGVAQTDQFVLVEQTSGGAREVPIQLGTGPQRNVHWLVEHDGSTSSRTYQIETRAELPSSSSVAAQRTADVLTWRSGEQPLLAYQFGVMPAPAGVDPAYSRSGFIHPLWSPQGQILTRVQPPDHYHHYGIWNPWTQVEFRGRTVDFWNLAKKEGTVRFAGFVSVDHGAVFGEHRALHDHVVFSDGTEEVALRELQTVRVYRPDPKLQRYIVDLTIELSCATDQPVRLLEYRYGGLGWRATEQWHRGNSSVLASEGQERAAADGALARWCRVQGETDGQLTGIVLMSHPGNYNHPEPLRVWPESSENGRGDLFANFSPTKNRDWLIQPGRTEVLRYRLLVFNGALSAGEAEASWGDFAGAATVRIGSAAQP